ncbi:HlyD family efflux transporter periplasmic adaptor subunit [uncultured Ruminococcus sp.]|uniref:HlyD family efflux transporter periplasmic adaptor subunit n=1 Tax=uncultured Ruminococcus sp. TaxID=165186 RepID=UPI0025CF5F17|nr:HlyD family efflux transporter periplasmic adaptor subunit [uncultured Ruminococcus sp.]
MNSLTVKILAALVSILMITTICTQVYHFFRDKHDTEEAVLATVNEDIVFDGIIVRDESVVTYNGGGVLDYKYADGSKVSMNSTIAEVFSDEKAIYARDRIAEIDEEIEQLEKAQDPATTNYVEPEALLSGVRGGYYDLLEAIENRDLEKIPEIRSQIALNSNMYGVITGKEAGFDEAISELKAEREKLQSVAAAPNDVIKADKTGYFVSYADGYEDQLKIGSVDKLGESDIREVIKGGKNPPANAIGKTFNSYESKIVGIVKADPRINEDAKVSLKLNSSRTVYDCIVDSVRTDGENMIVVLDCDRVDQTLVDSRVLSAKLIFDEYQGIRVPRSALRFRGDEKGVYVILGKDISFKKINVIYEGDDFVLSENTSDEEYLLLYDQILLEVVSNKDVSVSSSAERDEGSSE